MYGKTWCCTGDELEFELSFVPTDPSWQQGRQLTFKGVLRENFPASGSVNVTVKPASSLNQKTCSVLDKILASEIESIVSRQVCLPLHSSAFHWSLALDSKPSTATMLCTAPWHAAVMSRSANVARPDNQNTSYTWCQKASLEFQVKSVTILLRTSKHCVTRTYRLKLSGNLFMQIRKHSCRPKTKLHSWRSDQVMGE